MTLFQFLIFSITLWSRVRLLFATSIFNVVNCAVLLARNVVTVQFAGSIVQIVQFLIDFFLVLNFTFGFMTLSHLTIQTGWILFGIIWIQRMCRPLNRLANRNYIYSFQLFSLSSIPFSIHFHSSSFSKMSLKRGGVC